MHQRLTFIELPLTNELHGEYSITRSLIAAGEHDGGRAAPADHGFPEENIIDYIIIADCFIIREVKGNTSWHGPTMFKRTIFVAVSLVFMLAACQSSSQTRRFLARLVSKWFRGCSTMHFYYQTKLKILSASLLCFMGSIISERNRLCFPTPRQ